MTRTRIQLVAVWGNDDAESSIWVSRRRWTAIQSRLAIRQPPSFDQRRGWNGVRGGSSGRGAACD